MNKVVLIIRDGWGDAKAGPHNAVTNAKTPNMTNNKKIITYAQLSSDILFW